MMGRSHALSGLSAGVLAAGALPHAPLPVRLLLIPVIGGASLLPDLDHPQGTAARSIGFLTRWLAQMINEISLSIYHATRGPGDPRHKRDGHRLFTHTVPGCLVAGVPGIVSQVIGPDLAGSLGADPWWAQRVPALFTVAEIGICLGLLARTSRKIGTVFTLGGSALGFAVISAYPGWWWVWPVAVVFGCLAHVAGDGCTVSGVPVLWPIMLDGDRGPERWRTFRVPGAFETGREVETELITPVLLGLLVLCVGLVTGVLPAVFWAVISA